MCLHHAERGIAFLMPFADEMALLVELRFRRIGEPEPRHGDIGLVAVLLEEHPLQRLGAMPFVGGHEMGAFGEIPQDRAGFGKDASVLEFQHRHAAIRIPDEKLRLARGAVMQAIFLSARWECRADGPQAVPCPAIPRDVHLVKNGHGIDSRRARCGAYPIHLCVLPLAPLREAGPTVRTITPQAMRSPELPPGWPV